MVRQILHRPALAFMLGGLVVGAAFAGTAAYAKLTATTANTITACYKPNGEVTLIGLETKRNECKKNEHVSVWNRAERTRRYWVKYSFSISGVFGARVA